MAKLTVDPITGKKIERWNSKTHSFSTAKTTSKIGCDDLYKNHTHQKYTSTTPNLAKAQQKAGYKSRGNYQNASKTTPKKDGLAIASIVLAIISLIAVLDGDFQPVLVVLSIVFGVISKKKQNSKLAVVGIVVAILTIVIGAVILFGLIASELVGVSAITTNLN